MASDMKVNTDAVITVAKNIKKINDDVRNQFSDVESAIGRLDRLVNFILLKMHFAIIGTRLSKTLSTFCCNKLEKGIRKPNQRTHLLLMHLSKEDG